MSQPRVLLVDDSPDFLLAARDFLSTQTILSLIGEARSGENALEQVRDLKPDLVLLDLSMPGMNGIEVTGQLKAQPNPPRVIILTIHDELEYRRAAIEASADGFVSKSELRTGLMPLIESLFAKASMA